MTAPVSVLEPGVAGGPVEYHPVSQRRVLRSEWIKLRTLRSSIIVLVLTLVAMVGIGLLIAAVTKHNFDTGGLRFHGRFNAIDRVLGGVNVAQLTVGVLGVLVITGEYSTGMIRATFGAVPTRLPVLWAKLAVFAVVVFVVTLPASFLAFVGGEGILGRYGVSLSSPGALRAVFGVALYLTAVGLLGVSFGFIIRNTAGGIAALAGLLLVVPALSNLLPNSWQRSVVPYLPSNAGQALYTQHHDQPSMHPWPGLALFVGYVAVAIVIAAVCVRRRDA